MIPTTVLQQACSMGAKEYLYDLQFLQAFVCTFAAPMGFLVIGLLAWGAISLSYYIRQGSMIIPTVLLFLVGGVALAQTASIAQAAVVLLILVIPAGAAALLYYRYSR